MTKVIVAEGTFVVVADDAAEKPSLHIIVWRDETEVDSWNVALCGEGFEDYALVSFENTDGYPLTMVCGKCFESLGSHILATQAAAV